MKIYSYVVARDYGFAPNPFFGICTLATCKPKIRASSKVGDWIVGTGSKAINREGYLVYAMRVEEVLGFNDYWQDHRFQMKKPVMNGSIKQAYGDNIYYYRTKENRWIQINSHHSYDDGSINYENLIHDTQTPRVLVSSEFYYYGGRGVRIPLRFRNWSGIDICAKRHHKCNFPEEMVQAFIDWIKLRLIRGYNNDPYEFE